MEIQDPTPIPELPALEPGVTLLESEARGPLHTLVVDHVLLERTEAYWIDTHGYATTQPLAAIAPSDRILDRVHVARGFTPQQHFALCETLFDRTDIDPGLIVVPALDGQYRSAELYTDEPEAMLVRVLAKLAGLARRHECPVLVTRTESDDLSQPIADCASNHIDCVETPMGPRFVSEDFETLVYHLEDGIVQTTFAFWERVLEAREPLYGQAITPGMIARGTN